MKNVASKVEGNTLTITVDLSQEFGPSKSGKTTVVASTEGNITLADGRTVMGLNVYRYPARHRQRA
jgi:hypothetical protein